MQAPFTFAVRSGVVMLVALVSGCAVMQPYQVHYHDYETNKGWCGAAAASAGGAVAFARRVQTNLLCQAQQHASFASGLGATLVPLAGLLAYKGISGANSHNIAALSSGGFAAYSIGNYVYKPRDLIYFSGMKTIDCAVELTSPMLLTSDAVAGLDASESSAALRGHLTEAQRITRELLSSVRRTQAGLKSLVKAVDTYASNNGVAPSLGDQYARLVQESSARVDELRDRFEASKVMLQSATDAAIVMADQVAARLNDSRLAERDLVTTVESVQTQVNLQLATMQPDPKALASLLNGLKFPTATTTPPAAPTTSADAQIPPAASRALGSFSSFAGAKHVSPTLKTAAAAVDRAASTLSDALDDGEQHLLSLGDQLVEIHRILAYQRAVVSTRPQPINLTKLIADCSLDLHRPVPLTVSVPSGGLKAPNGAIARVPVVGGSIPYSVTVINPPSEGALATQIVVGSGNAHVVELSPTGFNSTSKVQLMVVDAHGTAEVFEAEVVVQSPKP